MKDREAGGRFATAVGSPLVVVPVAVGLLGVGAAVLAPADVADGGSAVDLVVGHPVVVGSLRTIVVVLALFLVASAVARAAGGSWVRRVGPVDASEEVAGVASDSEVLRADLTRAEAEVTRLTGELAAAVDLLDQMADTSSSNGSPGEEGRR